MSEFNLKQLEFGSNKIKLGPAPNKLGPSPNKVYNQDCLDYLRSLPDRLINTVILDPPYYNVVNEKWDKQWSSLNDYLIWAEMVIIEIERVAKYSCSLWLFGYPYQLGYLIPILERHGFSYRQHIVINKGLQAIAGRCSNKIKMFPTATEYVVYFHKEARFVLRDFLQSKQAEKQLTSVAINGFLGRSTAGGGTWSVIAGKRETGLQYPTREVWDKLQELFGPFELKFDDYVYKFKLARQLTDVWDDISFYDKTFPRVHPTQKPYKLIERLIEVTTDKWDNVLDPFMGSGMTAKVCYDKQRVFYGCEKEEKYMENNIFRAIKNKKTS